MALPASGTISISQVSVELSRAANFSTSLGETAVRNLAGVASGAISLSNLWGKSAFSATWTGSSQVNLSGTLYGFSVSGGLWRITDGPNTGGWITTNSNGTFTGDSTFVWFSNNYGYNTSGSSVRVFGGANYGAWLTFSIATGWSGGVSSAPRGTGSNTLNASGGQLQGGVYASSTYYWGPFVTIH